jgi:hypothetical protein
MIWRHNDQIHKIFAFILKFELWLDNIAIVKKDFVLVIINFILIHIITSLFIIKISSTYDY